MAKRNRRVQWSQLPEELLSLIAKKHLNTHIDNLRLRSVCGSWRSSVPAFNKPPPSLPLLLPFPFTRGQKPKHDGYFSLTESTIYLLLSPNQNRKPNTPTPWLIRVEEEIKNGKMRALHPLSQTKMPETFPRQVNLLNFGITEIGKAYSLRFIDLTNEPDDFSDDDDSTLFEKVVVSSNPWSGAGAGADDYAVMAKHGTQLKFFKLGDKKWTTIHCWDHSDGYQDFVYHKGRFYAVGSNGRTVVIGSDLKVKPIASLGPLYESGGLRLVNSCGDLYLIDKEENSNASYFNYVYCDDHMWQPIEESCHSDPLKSVYLKVYKLIETEKKWERIASLGDRVLFACEACSYSISARGFTGLKGNCIYFSEGGFGGDSDEEYYDEDVCLGEWRGTGVFNFVDGRCGPLAYFRDHSKIFWPPPPWLKPTSCAMNK